MKRAKVVSSIRMTIRTSLPFGHFFLWSSPPMDLHKLMPLYTETLSINERRNYCICCHRKLFLFLKVQGPTRLWNSVTNAPVLNDKTQSERSDYAYSQVWNRNYLTYWVYVIFILTGKTSLKSELFILNYKCDILMVFTFQ